MTVTSNSARIDIKWYFALRVATSGLTAPVIGAGSKMLILISLLSSAWADRMEGYIVGGQLANISDWPFITFIEATHLGPETTACGGSLLSSQTVLTAAHCLDDVTESKKFMFETTFTIYMGHSRYDRATMFRQALDYETHHLYNPKDLIVRYDVGVIFLRTTVEFSANVQKVILQRRYDVDADKDLAVAGWGATDPVDKYAPTSHNLKTVNLRSANYPKCQKMERVICTEADTQYAYSGDSGGPMVKADTRYQLGIVSFRDIVTGMTVFSSVPKYFKWIRRTNRRLFVKYCKK